MSIFGGLISGIGSAVQSGINVKLARENRAWQGVWLTQPMNALPAI